MTVTRVEQMIQNLNYGCISRISMGEVNANYKSDTYTKSIQDITQLFYNQVINNYKTAEEVNDFLSHLDMVQYIDRVKCYPGIENVPSQFSKQCMDLYDNIEEKSFSRTA